MDGSGSRSSSSLMSSGDMSSLALDGRTNDSGLRSSVVLSGGGANGSDGLGVVVLSGGGWNGLWLGRGLNGAGPGDLGGGVGACVGAVVFGVHAVAP